MQPGNIKDTAGSDLHLKGLVDRAAGELSSRTPLAITGLQGGALAWCVSSLALRLEEKIVLVTHSVRRAEALAGDIAFFLARVNTGSALPGAAGAGRPVTLFPQWDTVPYDGFSPNVEVAASRFGAMQALLAEGPAVVVTTPQAWMQGMMPLDVFSDLCFRVETGRAYPRRELLEALHRAGYVRVDLVESPGEYSVRGDILDVFSPQWDHPARLDFFGDELEALRIFEVGTQKSIGEEAGLTIFPSREGVISPETVSLALKALPHFKGRMQPALYRQWYGYLEQGSPFPGCEMLLPLLYGRTAWLGESLPPRTLVLLEQPARLHDVAASYHAEVLGEFELNLHQGSFGLDPQEFYQTPVRWKKELSARYTVPLEPLLLEEEPGALSFPLADNSFLRLETARPEGEQEQGEAPAAGLGHQALGNILAKVRAWRDSGARVVFACRTETGAERMRQLLAQFELGAVVQASLEISPEAPPPEAGSDPCDFVIMPVAPSQGFRVVSDLGVTRFALITEEELLGEKTRQRRLKKSSLQHFLSTLGDLKVGDHVVHVEYGIGRYEGLRKLAVAGEGGDFLVLSYAGGDKVYVPVYKFHQVQRYTGVEGSAPQLNRLGDGSWARTRQRAARVVEDMAEELVTIYAARKASAGHAFERHPGLMAEFEESFEYQETEDQERAIQEVLDDLSGDMPMDRLVCGDVGFGKTEVAMRAAYLCVLGGRQVIMLVPTTILAQQHYETFVRRFENFGVRVEVISRFRPPREQKQVVADFSKGEVDILIGTHRLLSKDIQPGNLGLLVIDEEQRFGVGHKERIKQLRMEVEVLTLSATPIPRTLHMSLMGVRDLSVINTPPMDRIAVRTRLVKSSDYIITEAIERELRRGGQIFMVHNRVETIHQFGNYVQSLLPHVRMAIAHGQMGERQLEDVMHAFMKNEVQVLLSTSIVESGLDIPRANTILINEAQHFGLAQLYQLRGRVGRSNVQAYAYLLISPERVLTDVAQKRLTLLQELNDLGSGFRIASHDLEIRGAGNLLGREQSGHINAVGLELFTRMVEEAVTRLKGEEAPLPALECKLDLGFPYLLPEDYISGTQQRLEIYRQFADVRTEEELWDLRQTLEDRFGGVPQEVDNLLDMIRIRLVASRFGLSSVERGRDGLVTGFGRPELIDVEALMARISKGDSSLRLLPGDRLLLGPMPQSPQGVLGALGALEKVMIKPAGQ
ncbi:MAG: transcription-repair coupling factor [Deltaproteobacteria bacterium]|nr:transcription-repair coupling factor [Deltaproteobacteria bacterium]